MADNWELFDNYIDKEAPLNKKYSYTITDGKVYYLWNDVNNQFNKKGFNWRGLFDASDSISYRSTARKTGEKEIIDLSIFEKSKVKQIEVDKIEPTGFLLPFYEFLNITDKQKPIKETYQNALELFGLVENSNIPPNTINEISAYRKLLFEQIVIQANEVNKINNEIVRVLKVYYFETEQAVLELFNQDISGEEKEELKKNRLEFFYELEHLFKVGILKGGKSDNLAKNWLPKRLKSNKFITDHLKEATFHGVYTLAKKRDPILETSFLLSEKLKALDSILEDAILNDRVKSINEYQKEQSYRDLPIPEEVAYKFCHHIKNKAGIYSPKLITKALEWVRNYIYDRQLETLRGNKRPITNFVKDVVPELKETDSKTVDNWVQFYWDEYRPIEQAQTEH